MMTFQFCVNSYLRLANMSDDPVEKREYMLNAKKLLEEYAHTNNIKIQKDIYSDLIDIIRKRANEVKKGKTQNISYDEMRNLYGEDIFKGEQPKRVLDGISYSLKEEGIIIQTGKTVKYNGITRNGFGLRLSEV